MSTNNSNAGPTPSPVLPRTEPEGIDRRNAATPGERRTVVFWIVLALAARTLVAALVPLLPDETYYWEWARHLAAGYFDHPPGVALMIALGTALLGDTTAGVRLGPAVAALLVHVSIVTVAARLGGTRAAIRAACIAALLPLSTLGLVLATPDAPLLASAAVAFVCLERALGQPVRSRGSLAWWTLTGLALGAAFVSKYTAVLLPFALVVACTVYRPLRARFAEPGPWLASALALLLFLPVALWNARTGWVSFRFQFTHGFGAAPRGTPVGRELEMIGGQLGLATPILGVLLFAAVLLALRNGWRMRHAALATDIASRVFALAVMALVPFAFFAASAWRRPIEPNWQALFYPSAIVLLATARAPWMTSRWWKAGVALAAFVLVVAILQTWKPLLPLAPARDPIARAHGWAALAGSVERARHDPVLAGTAVQWAAAERYQDASEVAFNLPGQPEVFSLNLTGRANQYDLWPAAVDRIRPGDGLVAAFDATPHGDSLATVVGSWFMTTRRGETVQLRRGEGVVGERRLWLYRGAVAIPRVRARLPGGAAGR